MDTIYSLTVPSLKDGLSCEIVDEMAREEVGGRLGFDLLRPKGGAVVHPILSRYARRAYLKIMASVATLRILTSFEFPKH